ncbi:MAG: Type 1 glutamine amidotransferase-like domain-containing protein [Planctomycetes bacterium]|nr:Type 1 glutamine amidotransferase-like domain-containing protein [Planctomycetota bacterium]
MRRPLVALLLLFGCASPPASSPDPRPGVLWVCGGGTLAPELLAEFVRDAGGGDARLVLIPGASRTAEEPEALERQVARWRERGVAEVVVLHSRDRAEADAADFVAPLRSATAVWFGGGDQKRLAEVYAGTRVETEIKALLARGGAVGGTSAGAAIQSRVMIGGRVLGAGGVTVVRATAAGEPESEFVAAGAVIEVGSR